MNKTQITRPLLNQVRAELRKLLKANRLEARRTYYDYYDSCHPPTETPDAPFSDASLTIRERYLMAGGDCLYIIGPGHYQLSNSYSTYEIRLKKQA